ncbi:hypothetical protein CROQUDRAFT_79035 [Cronartium quercuum f. sp. fusiforme G11]|uniref:Nuclear control of ATPase protein 2 n=1 Tax=Cronartium quercuum f. sp. fusiforme G11 TaxID=708437 RepID=A0A9P6NJG9_9BASI|nr:hypothetical protein CROQUDRAFT_79035 [Cronartium quercuum f. sp. fusiforme G11]
MSSYARLKTEELAYEIQLTTTTTATATAQAQGLQLLKNVSQTEPSLAQLSLESCGTMVECLVADAFAVEDWLEWWREVENEPMSFFLQTLPNRLLSSIQSHAGPFRWINLFPSIANAQQYPDFLSTLSPLFLIKHEARQKRKELETIHTHLTQNIGTLISLLLELESRFHDAPQSDLTVSFSELVECMRSISPFKSPSVTSSSLGQLSIDAMTEDLSQLRKETIPDLKASISVSLAHLSPPSFLTRAWPLLVSLPVAAYTLAKLAYSYRGPIVDGLLSARDTFRGFVSGWVLKPVEDIVETLKAGERGTLAIMSEESLSAEFASLERMTLDFGRERFGWDDDQAGKVAASVREGDLTEVLRVWENEIRTPIRSALAGSLVRVMLIQIQKVKVDLAIAMEGIQSILRSQSLTFGAIGVAPSMLICFLLGKLVSSLIRHRLGVVGKGTKAVRREVRQALRQMEQSLILITSAPEHPLADAHKRDPKASIGLLFLHLHRLRAFANSSHFPRHQLACKPEYLDDLAGLEDLRVGWVTKRKLVKRFVTRWGSLVGL